MYTHRHTRTHAHTTRVHSLFSSPTTGQQFQGPSSTPPPLHAHTPPPTPPAAFLQLGVLQPESHAQLGRRGEERGSSLSPSPCKHPHPAAPTLPSVAGGSSLQTPFGLFGWGEGWGGTTGFWHTVNKPRRGGRGSFGGQRGPARECAADRPDRGRAGLRRGGPDAISAGEPGVGGERPTDHLTAPSFPRS